MATKRPRSFDAAKPHGILAHKVQAVGPLHFGIVAVDVGKHVSKFAFYNYYGSVLHDPTPVRHHLADIQHMVACIHAAQQRHQIKDLIVAVETTGSYHRPLVQQWRRMNLHWDIRHVHPHASRHFRLPADLGTKTDDTDLAAIFRAASQGFGLTASPWPDAFEHLRIWRRHRRDLVDKRAAVQKQIREELHLLLPGFDAQFCHLWESDTPLSLARACGSPQRILELGLDGLRQWAKDAALRMQEASFHKILHWAKHAPPGDPFASVRQRRLDSLDRDRLEKSTEIDALELQVATLLARTPYVRLLAIPGLNVVSAGDIAGEFGPMQLYPHPNAITGRAGLMPSRYQSADVDRPNGPLTPRRNARIRAVLMQAGLNLAHSNNYFKAQDARYQKQGKPTLQRVVKIAKSFSRIAYHVVLDQGRFNHPCMAGDAYVVPKLAHFLLQHKAGPQPTQTILADAVGQLDAAWAQREEKPVLELVDSLARAKRGGVRALGETIDLILTKLRLLQSQTGGAPPA